MEMLLSQRILFINLALFGYVHPTVTPTNFKCDFNREICDPSYCLLMKGRGKFKYASVGCNFIKPIKAATLYVENFRRNKLGEYESMNLRLLTDICNLENIKGNGGLINNVINMSMRSLSSIKCPLLGNITIPRMPLMLFILEGLFPPAEYKIFVKVHNAALTIANMNITISATSAKH